MVERIEWIKRQFAFALPLGMYPNVVERVRGTPARLEDLARSLAREILTRRDGDKRSIQEQAGHLLDLESLGMNRLDDFEAGRDPLSAADMENRKTHEGLFVSEGQNFRGAVIRTISEEAVAITDAGPDVLTGPLHTGLDGGSVA